PTVIRSIPDCHWLFADMRWNRTAPPGKSNRLASRSEWHANANHALAAALFFERTRSRPQQVVQRYHSDQFPMLFTLEDWKTCESAFRHAIHHRTQRFVGIRHDGFVPHQRCQRLLFG